jgi:hypothetical protein
VSVSLLRKWAAWVLVCLWGVAAAAQSDRELAALVLGPDWKRMARTAGMVFSGTVVEVGSGAKDEALPTIQVKLRVERAIAGVEQGQVLTIREWAGAWSMHRPLQAGERVLLLLYPPSSLGFTSPVSGSHGQIALDASGIKVAQRRENVTVQQLERAIRSARLSQKSEVKLQKWSRFRRGQKAFTTGDTAAHGGNSGTLTSAMEK